MHGVYARFKHRPRIDRWQLTKIAAKYDRHSTEWIVVVPRDFLKPDMYCVEDISTQHACFVDNDELHVGEGVPVRRSGVGSMSLEGSGYSIGTLMSNGITLWR